MQVRDPRTDEEAPAPDDSKLVARAQSGDPAAFEELVRRNGLRVFGIAYHMLGHREDAEDVTQNVFLKAHRSLSRFQGRSAFSSWLHRIAVNETYNFLKKRRKTRHLSLADMDPLNPDNPVHARLLSNDSPIRAADLKDLQEKLNAALQSLSHTHRTVVVLHEIEGLPHEEIADLMGCSVGTVRSRLYYARQQLQGLLSDFAP